MQFFLGVVDYVDVFEKSEAHNIPVVLAKGVGEQIGFGFIDHFVESVVGFPVFDVGSSSECHGRYPASYLLLFVFDRV